MANAGGNVGGNLGLGIGLGAKLTDTFPQIAQIAEEKSRRLDEAKRLAAQAKQKRWDQVEERFINETNVDTSKLDPIFQDKIIAQKDKMMGDILEASISGKDPIEFMYGAEKAISGFKSEYGKAFSATGTLTKFRDGMDKGDLTPFQNEFAQALVKAGNDKDKLDEWWKNNHDPTNSYQYDPVSGTVGVNYVNKKIDYNKMFDDAGKSVQKYQQVPVGEIAGHTEAIERPFYTQAEAQKFQQKHPGVGDVNSIEGVAQETANSNPQAFQEWFYNQAPLDPNNYDKNGNLDKNAVWKSWNTYLYNGIKSRVPGTVKDISQPKNVINVSLGDKKGSQAIALQNNTTTFKSPYGEGNQTTHYSIPYTPDKQFSLTGGTIGFDSKTGIAVSLPGASDIKSSQMKVSYYIKDENLPYGGYRKANDDEINNPDKKRNIIAVPVAVIQYPKSVGSSTTDGETKTNEGEKVYTEYEVPLQSISGSLVDVESKENAGMASSLMNNMAQIADKENAQLDQNGEIYADYVKYYKLRNDKDVANTKPTSVSKPVDLSVIPKL